MAVSLFPSMVLKNLDWEECATSSWKREERVCECDVDVLVNVWVAQLLYTKVL